MNFKDKYSKEDLERLIFEEKKSYREIGRIYGVSDTYIKKVCGKLGIKLPTKANFPEDFKPYNYGSARKIKCKNCGEEIIPSHRNQIFCCHSCFFLYKRKKTYKEYLNNQENYCNKLVSLRFVKPHILKEQNHKCAICDISNEWNGQGLIFVLDHIDGDAKNNLRDNLRLICPNCDSQLDTFKSKNKNSSRKERYLLNYKNYPDYIN